MSLNELNSVEHYIIHQLSGVNLNSKEVQEPTPSYGAHWEFKSAEEIRRSINEVMNETTLKEALVRLNPEIAANPNLPMPHKNNRYNHSLELITPK